MSPIGPWFYGDEDWLSCRLRSLIAQPSCAHRATTPLFNREENGVDQFRRNRAHDCRSDASLDFLWMDLARIAPEGASGCALALHDPSSACAGTRWFYGLPETIECRIHRPLAA